MCIRDRRSSDFFCSRYRQENSQLGCGRNSDGQLRRSLSCCLLYTSDAADERSSVDLGGPRIIKKKKITRISGLLRDRRHIKASLSLVGEYYDEVKQLERGEYIQM